MDNASNNQTMIENFSHLLLAKGIFYDPTDNYVHCFGHVINLSSMRVVNKFCEIHSAPDTYDDDYDEDTLPHNPLMKCRKTVQVVRASGQRCDYFPDIIKDGNTRGHFKDSQGATLPVVQLLHDVRT